MHLTSRSKAGLVTGVLTALGLVAGLVTALPAQADNRVTPGSFTGLGFDQCIAPSQEVMDVWMDTSPFSAVGIYIAGDNRYCGDDKQVHLDREWVTAQLRNGWRLLPITVGPQASCSSRERYRHRRIEADPADRYALARAQGREEARDTVRAARRLGITERSTLWYDLEHFDAGRLHCRESALAFLSAWTNKLHALDYVSGVYSSGSSGIKALDDARVLRPGTYTMPDRIWVADWNGRATVASQYVRPDGWMPGGRIHQHIGDREETHGGITIHIDRNYLDLGRGSVAPREHKPCGGVSLSFRRYPRLERGDRGARVRAVHCRLRQAGYYTGEPRSRYTARTARAVRRFRADLPMATVGIMDARPWTALLSRGPRRVLKLGSANHAVRRVQRALNAASRAGLEVTGVYDRTTAAAVREYQRRRGLRRTGVVADDTWEQLQQGRR
jgi:hypothetical protein